MLIVLNQPTLVSSISFTVHISATNGQNYSPPHTSRQLLTYIPYRGEATPPQAVL